jgi:alkaline phosphatase D
MTAVPPVPSPSRRSVLTGGLLLGGALATGVALPGVASAAAAPRLRSSPFTLGVASGDPTSTGIVLWTRLAVDPLADDGLGGMPNAAYSLTWQLSTEPRFRNIVRTGRVQATPETAHSVHVEVEGLEPGREYWYRFRTAGHVSPAARTLTAPAPRSFGPPLALAVASCAQYEAGFFTAYRRLAQDEPDLVLHLGDYFYENANPASGSVRTVAGPEVQTVADYRRRHAQYKSDLDLQAAHAVAPWVVVFDDHEVDNNWADEVPENDQPNFLARRAAAFQAYYENMPLRSTSLPQGIDMQLYRRIQWGRLATFHMLDTRQYRSDQACGDGVDADCAARLDEARSITGAEQEAWLLDGLGRSPTVGVELVTTSVTSGGNGSDTTPATDVQLAENPHIRFANTQRGYLRARLTRQELQADFRVIPFVTQPGAPVSTRQSFRVDAGQTGLQPVQPVQPVSSAV